jgi:D-3-phosphoglycerate dehydrogenase / 2-oxoglutarate reductase
MAFFRYEDRPGVIGKVGSILGEAGVNIASMEVGRREAGGLALMGLTVDSPIPQEALEQIVETVGTKSARSIVVSG